MVPLEKLLEESRHELLDLTTRNRLLSMPVQSKSVRTIEVKDEKSEAIFHILVTEKKVMTFAPGIERSRVGEVAANAVTEANSVTGANADHVAPAKAHEPLDEDEDEASLPQPDGDPIDEQTGMARRHVDSRLQTSLTSEGLQRRLLALYRDARTIEEEQGVNILYLALGRLKWFEAEKAETPRFAPLLLVPVELRRQSASDRFTLRWSEEEMQENLSLEAKLKTEFGLSLPRFPHEEEPNLAHYFQAVGQAIEGRPNWEIQPDGITLGFFSFAKYLMYRDLDSANWPTPESLLNHPFLGPLLRDGFPTNDNPFPVDVHLDELIPASRLDHIVDADSSQSIAVERVRAGENLVIQGPPGTGKSQSISNIIAAAVLDGKRVLFVAEKLAALEVVKRRLEAAGLGDMCLELHSHKAHKRAVLEELGRTWQLGRPLGQQLEGQVPKLEEARKILNDHVAALHTPIEPWGLTLYQIVGRLTASCEVDAGLEELSFDGAEAWTANERERRQQLCSELVERTGELGAPGQHPWHGVRRTSVLAIDLPPLRKRLSDLDRALQELTATAVRVAESLGQPAPPDFSYCELLRRMAEHVASAPSLDRDALCSSVWQTGLDGLGDLIRAGQRIEAAKAKLLGKVADIAWETDLLAARTTIAAHGTSFFKIFNGEYRRADAALRGVLAGPAPRSQQEKLALLDELIAGQKALRFLQQADETGRRAFGGSWRGENSDWPQLQSIFAWVNAEAQAGLGPEVRGLFAKLEHPENAGAAASELGERSRAAWFAVNEVFAEVQLDITAAFGVATTDAIPIGTLMERVTAWLARLEELSRWCAYEVRAESARAMGLTPLIGALESGILPGDLLLRAFERSYYSQLVRALARRYPEFAQFDGILHNRNVERFRQLDRERLALARYRVRARHFDHLPSRQAAIGATGVVLGELERKRGHRPVRKLLKDAGSVVQAIKPVFMMSPLSVAQFLEPGAVEFDLVVIDEASQVQPVDALGAIVRSRQVVVVGDSRQLPPTRFFARLTSNDADEDRTERDGEAAHVQDVESILGLCCARGVAQAMLRWHYRSRHHSLIAVSNREFYENQLFIVPSPYLATSGLGLKFTHVPEGVFDSGGSGTNRVEARAVCRAILEHVRQNANFSLGVAAFSARQQQAILDELELLRRENPDLESFFHAHPHEPFFVKNLENVQGDERDVIFISVGYGPDRNGYLAMRFGPLSNEGGERRLNVLISRAKRRCEVFASLTADDIDLNRANGRGVHAFKTFLQFAQTGRFSVTRLGGEEQSPFEEAVRRNVERLGYEVHPQVGVAGFFIDLGVVDPVKPGRYLLGIECDGASYHSSRSARDRDRLRQAVLEDHGWILHRIWSTDWFQRPGEQLKKVADAIERARVAIEEQLVVGKPTAVADETGELDRETASEPTANESVFSSPYVEASFEVPQHTAPHELTPKAMADLLFRIVEIEGPIHEDELTGRVRDLWQLGRAGSRIQDSVARGITALLTSRRCVREEACLLIPGAPIVVRNRELAQSASLRKPDLLPKAEVRVAILSVLKASHGGGEKEIAMVVARAMGFKATGSSFRAVISEQIRALHRQGAVIENDGLLRVQVN